MNCGRLNKPITITHVSQTETNSLGEEIAYKEENILTRADVRWGSGSPGKPIGKREVDYEIGYTYDVTFIVWIYLYKKIKEGDVVKYAGKKYSIVSMEPVPETKTLYLKCETV